MKKLSLFLIFVLGLSLLSYGALALDKKGLVLYINFDEGKGGEAADLSGNNNKGKLLGGAKWVQGKIKGGVYLADIPDLVEVADSNSLDITEALTLAIWANIESLPNGSCALFQKPTAYMLHTTNGGVGVKIDPLVFIGGNYGAWPTPVTVSGTFNEWHHFAATYDGKSYNIYVDGKRMDGYDRQTAGKIDVDSNPLAIGRDNRGCCAARNSPCIIDEASVWSRALKESEIKDLMNGGLTAVQPGYKLSTCWGNIKDAR
ncbi:LamG domain-containing protein [Candidatus Poribacteria bacterium]|nr:LamG domain-containing protein [Candidatus Poribacteria bacterium]